MASEKRRRWRPKCSRSCCREIKRASKHQTGIDPYGLWLEAPEKAYGAALTGGDPAVASGLRDFAETHGAALGDRYVEFGGLVCGVAELRIGDSHSTIVFEDGSSLSFMADGGTLDEGPPLLEPISSGEFSGVEVFLGHLWELTASGDLSPGVAAQLRALASAIEDERRETEVASSLRWRLVGLVRAASRAFMRSEDFSKNLVAASVMAQALTRIDWHSVARVLTPG